MIVYHYCSNAAFTSIVAKKEIWLSELSLSNDVMEGRWIRAVFKDICEERGVSAADEERLLGYLDVLLKMLGGTGLCTSEEGDLLSQWRGYADDGAGVSIGINKNYLDELGNLKRDRGDDFNLTTVQVEYDRQRQKQAIAEQVDEMLKLVSGGVFRFPTILSPETEDHKKDREKKFYELSMRFLLMFPHVWALKNPTFAEEKEWRILSFVLGGQERTEETRQDGFPASNGSNCAVPKDTTRATLSTRLGRSDCRTEECNAQQDHRSSAAKTWLA